MTDDSQEYATRRSSRLSAFRAWVQRRASFSRRADAPPTFLRSLFASPARWQREHWLLAGAGVAVTVLVGVVIPSWAVAMRQPAESAPLTTLSLPLPALPAGDPSLSAALDAQNADPLMDESNWQVVKVRAGQSLADIFDKQGLNASDLQKLLDDRNNISCLRNIHPGDEFAFQRDPDGVLLAIRFDRDEHTRVIASFSNEGIKQTTIERNVERRTLVAHGVIDSSLFGAGEEAGMSDAMVLKLAGAFGYDIDFAQDLRQGDSFTVIYDDIYREGERLRDGDIIAATFVNHGKRYSAFRFTNAQGDTMFYSDDGRPLRKAFLRTPVEFTRITSLFSAGRMHPILGLMRAHKGVDYAAPSGTPIRAAGEGKIAFRGWQPGYGNVVIVQHNSHTTTLYGHMSHFGNEQIGQHVAQGQTIGFVGMTGLATGPHLHYEFRIDGQHRDPLTVTTLPPDPLPAVELAHFRAQTQPVLAKLKTLEATQLASAK